MLVSSLTVAETALNQSRKSCFTADLHLSEKFTGNILARNCDAIGICIFNAENTGRFLMGTHMEAPVEKAHVPVVFFVLVSSGKLILFSSVVETEEPCMGLHIG